MTEPACSAQGCEQPGRHACAYEDDLGVRCASAWCDEHIERVGGVPVCRRHRQTLEIIQGRQQGVFELHARPSVADRSLSLATHLAQVMDPSMRTLLESHAGAWPDGHVESEHHPRPFWDHQGQLSGWELGWSILSPRGHHLRVAVRARSGGDRPSVQVIAEHLVAYDGEPGPESVRGSRTEAQIHLLEEIESLLGEALRELPAGWQAIR